ncbi:MAG: EAL domain-containing protein [Rhizobiaceae bacterium]
MSGQAATRAQQRSRDIRIDEAGIHTGLWGAFRLKSVFQPVYLRDRERLVPFAVEGRTLPYVDGAALSEQFRRAVLDEELPALDRLDRALHVGNLETLDSPDLQLFVAFDVRRPHGPSVVAEEARSIEGRLRATEIDTNRMVWVLRGHSDVSEETLASYVNVVRSSGMGLATEESAPVFTSPERLAIIKPDFVRVAVSRLALLSAAAVLPLVRAMFAALRERGARVLVSGIGQPPELSLALDAGADCLQGVLLAAPGLAGTLFDLPPLDADRLRSRVGKIVPLFG